MVTLILATRNAHKADEIRTILGAGWRYLTLKAFPEAPQVVENADTFAGNAAKKALELAQWLAASPDTRHTPRLTPPRFVLADDSGLEVDALNGAPGVHSARYAALDAGLAGNASDAANNAKLLRLLAAVSPGRRAARFHCVLALVQVEDRGFEGRIPRSALRAPQLFEGVCEGRIDFNPRGQNGFGYDPLFIPSGFEQTFAELGDETKNRLSHRSKALAKLRDWLRGCVEQTPPEASRAASSRVPQ